MADLDSVIRERSHESFMLSGYAPDGVLIPERLLCFHPGHQLWWTRAYLLESRVTGRMGYSNSAVTRRALDWIDSIHPDVVHFHNIHGNWVNVYMLAGHVAEMGVPVVWTLHDCWSFTGRCSHFELCGCERWVDGCHNCTNMKVYPISYFFDRSPGMWRDKREAFTSFDRACLVTPSSWLADYAARSFLGKYPVRVVHNGIDVSAFRPLAPGSDSAWHDFGDRKVVLGVASSWSDSKGLGDFFSLAEALDSSRYQVVLIGLNSRQLADLPRSVHGIGRTANLGELAVWYSKASVFVNMTYQDNYPTVNLEAIACGTPVVTYETGGSSESVTSETGLVVPQGSIDGVLQAVERICTGGVDYTRACRSYAVTHFDKGLAFSEYMDIYESMAAGNA